MNDSPINNRDDEKKEEDFFSLSPGLFKSSKKTIPEPTEAPATPIQTEEEEREPDMTPNHPQRPQPLKIEPIESSRPVLDLSKKRFPDIKSALPQKGNTLSAPTMKSDSLGSKTPLKTFPKRKAFIKKEVEIIKKKAPLADVLPPQKRAVNQDNKTAVTGEKTSPDRPDKYHEAIEDSDTPRAGANNFSKNVEVSTIEKEGLGEVGKRIQQIETVMPKAGEISKVGVKDKKIRPDRPDRYHEPIDDLAVPSVTSTTALSHAKNDNALKSGLSEIEKRIQQIETVMPGDTLHPDIQTPTSVTKEAGGVSETDGIKNLDDNDIEKAVSEIRGYIEMIGGIESDSKLFTPEEIANMSRDLLLGKPNVKISQIPTNNGVQALVIKFAKELGADFE